MGQITSIKLSDLEADHKKLMKNIVGSMIDTPYVLKGGTALMLGYKLDRFSEDLDFDSPIKINMESRIKKVAGIYFKNLKIETTKNTDTVQRYRVNYECATGKRKLKIETSFREKEINPDNYQIIDSMKIYKIAQLLDKKLKAAHDGDNTRTAIRDIYDIWFIVKNYSQYLNKSLFNRYDTFCNDINQLNERYFESYQNDDLVNSKISLEALCLGLEEERRKNKKLF